MDKVGLITFHRAHNYGAALQVYALNRIINEMGYDCEVIDYTTKEVIETYSVENEKMQIPFYLKGKVKTRHQRFVDFQENYLKLSPNKFSTLKELESAELPYDIYVTGSDQVWNPLLRGVCTKAHFLSFVEDKKRIAYAASLGKCTLGHLKQYEPYIEKFDTIYMREDSGTKIISQMLDRDDVETVLDPTFLLSKKEWTKLTNKRYTGRPYMLCYCVGTSDEELKNLMDISKVLSKKFHLPICLIMYNQLYHGLKIYNCLDAGPMEFIDLIRNASLVCANSFHAMAMSINLNTPFYSISRSRTEQDTRKIDTLRIFGFQERLLCNCEEAAKEEDYKMSFEESNKILCKMRKDCKEKLKGALTK